MSMPMLDSLPAAATLASNEGAPGDKSPSTSEVPSMVIAINLGLYSIKSGNSRRKDGSPLVVMKKETP